MDSEPTPDNGERVVKPSWESVGWLMFACVVLVGYVLFFVALFGEGASLLVLPGTIGVWVLAIVFIVRRKRHRHPLRLVLYGLAAIVFTGLLSAMTLESFVKMIETSRAIRCRENLKAIAFAVGQYQDAHSGEYPPSLQVLLDGGYIKKAEILSCPSMHRTPLDLHSVDATSDYSYWPIKLPADARHWSCRVPIAWEKEAAHGGLWITTAFADLHVTSDEYPDLARSVRTYAGYYVRPPTLPLMPEPLRTKLQSTEERASQ
jgi:hypothetical protein